MTRMVAWLGLIAIVGVLMVATPATTAVTLTAVTTGGYHTCALTSGAGILCWGSNSSGELGDGTTTGRVTPVAVSGLSNGVSAVAAGFSHTCALTTGGAVVCWGDNLNGDLGDGTITQRLTPVAVSGLSSGVSAIAAGEQYACALTSVGGVVCWGHNSSGQLGDSTTANRLTPVAVSGLSTGVVAVAAGVSHSCALTGGGGVVCWGENGAGQLGDGTTASHLTPVAVSGLSSGVLAIATGANFTCAVTIGGGVRCWGYNSSGQLGDGTTTERVTPMAVSGLSSGVTAIASGYANTCALTNAGVRCWGMNDHGQLGDGTTTTRTAPVAVSGMSSGGTAIASGYGHTCAATSLGGAQCWGDNLFGDLGDGTIAQRLTPVAVNFASLPSITSDPVDVSVTAGGTATFSAAATATPLPGVQWQVSTSGGTTWSEVTNDTLYSGTTSATLTITNAPASLNRARYRMVASTSTGVATSAAATLTVFGAVTVAPSSLRFAGTRAGASGNLTVTAAQSLTITFAGAGSSWAVATNQPWVQITGGSGTGAGTFTVGIINPNNVIGNSTSLAATVTLTPATAGLSAVVVPVTLTIDQTGGATKPAFGQVDTPAQGAVGVVGAIGVTGWVVDDVGIASVKVYRGCLPSEPPANCQSGVVSGVSLVFVGDGIVVPGARPDVEAAFPTYPAANQAGFGLQVLTNMLPRATGTYAAYGGQGPITFYVIATDVEGHATLLSRIYTDSVPTPTSVTMDNDHISKPFGTIDTPAQGATSVSGTFANFGWALTPDTNTTVDSTDILIPTTGATMVVYIDGVATGTVAYSQCRGNVGNPVPAGAFCNDDIANIFGNPAPQATLTARTANGTLYRNLDAARAAIGAYTIDTTTLANGQHTLAWSVTDSAGRNEGVGSRYFTVLNSGNDPLNRTASELAGAPTVERGVAVSLEAMTLAREGVWARTGFDLAAPFGIIYPVNALRSVLIDTQGRVEVWLGPVDRGYLLANDTLRDLPPGSHLDTASGQFTWAPGPGYLGTYHLAFLRGKERVLLNVTIRPPE